MTRTLCWLGTWGPAICLWVPPAELRKADRSDRPARTRRRDRTLSAYDFHSTSDGQTQSGLPRLVAVNTASRHGSILANWSWSRVSRVQEAVTEWNRRIRFLCHAFNVRAGMMLVRSGS